MSKCDCGPYRPALDWPDSEGHWWCTDGQLYWFDGVEIVLLAEESTQTLTSDSVCFTKLLETNPFGKETQ